MILGNLKYVVDADISPLKSRFNEVKKVTDKYSDSLKKIGQSLSLYVTAPIVALGGASIKMASDFDESLNKVDVAFKDSAGSIRNWSKTTLTAYGIAQGTALDMAALFGDMATSMGLPTDKAADMSKSLVGLAGDLASFKNIGIDQAMTALNGIFTGETESLKRVGVVMLEDSLNAFALANGINKTVQKMTQAEKVQLRYAFVMSQTTNAQGDFTRTGGGAANQMRVFMESMKEVGVMFGQVMLPYFTSMIKKVNEWITGFKNLTPETKKVIVVVAGIAAAIGPLSLGLGVILKMMPYIITGFAALSSVMLPAIGVILAIGAAYLLFKDRSDDATKAIRSINESVGTEISKMNYLFSAINKAGEGTKERNNLIDIANKRYGSYLPNLLSEKSSLEDIAIAQKAATKALIANLTVKAVDQKITELITKNQEDFNNALGSFINNDKIGTDLGVELTSALQTAVEDATYNGGKYANEVGAKFWNKWYESLSKTTGYTDFTFDDFMKSFFKATDTQLEFNKQLTLLEAFSSKYRTILNGVTGSGDNDASLLSGLIPNLEAQIKKLEAQKLTLFDESEILNISRQIDGLKNKLESLSAWKMNNLEPLKPLESSIIKTGGVITESVQKLRSDLSSIGEVISSNVMPIVIDLGGLIQGALIDSFDMLGTAIGTALAGGKFGGEEFLIMMADWAKQLGAIMVAAGLAVFTFEAQLAINPLAVAAIGAALIVAGAAVKASIASRPGGTGSGGGGGYSSGGNGGGGVTDNPTQHVVFDIRGDVLRALITNDSRNLQRLR